MSEADKDGRVARMVSDRHACLSIEIHESLRDAAERVAALLGSDADG